jgi:hypothetical protein
MKAKITVHFKRIIGKKVNEKLLKENPALFEKTKETVAILCQQIKRYFNEHQIKTGVNFELENDKM